MTASSTIDLPTLDVDAVQDLVDCEVVAKTDDLTGEAWLAGRRAGLGGSDAAALLGVSRWSSPYDLWLDKTGRKEPDSDGPSAHQDLGTFMEPWILRRSMLADPDLSVARAPYQLRHRDHPELLANVDGLATHKRRGGWGGVEAKKASAFLRRQWADGPPVYYEAQVQHYMAVTGLDWWVVVAWLDGNEVEIWTFERQDQFLQMLVERELEWWQRHVVEDVEPLADRSPATTAALSLITPDPGSVATVDHNDLEVLFEQLAASRDAIALHKDDEDEMKNRVRQLMGEHTELLGDDGTKWATWRPAKAKTVVDHNAAHTRAALALGLTVDELLAPHTTTKPGARTLRVDAGLKQIQES